MRSISIFALSLLPTFLLLLCLLNGVAGVHEPTTIPNRKTIEIIIGGGYAPAPSPDNNEECPPPPPPPCEPPPPPPSPPPPSPPPPSPPPPSPPPPSPPPPSPPPPSPPPPSPPPPKVEDRVEKVRRVIQDFGKLIVDDPFHVKKSWSGRDPCKYRGFTCDNLPDLQGQNAVAGVDFNGFKFAGKDGKLSLKRFIDRLPDLAFFHANSNNFTEVPIIGTDKIRFLYELDLSNSKLTGEFPYQVLSAINLTFLDLRFNQFYGRVPREVFNLDVQVIFINNNYFDQSLPDNLGSTPALYLTFANNRFTGQIPSSIGRARNLLEVLFLKNQFSGCLPYEIGFLNKLTLFDASHNHITGPIPHSFGCLAKIELLNLANNELYGAVPESVCKLRNLGNLSLAGNYFTQVGTECRKLINKKYLDLNKNCILDLPNQRSKYECARFFSEPRRCPNEKYLTYIPCKNQWYHSASETDQESSAFITGEKIAPAPSTPVTYAALTPRGL